MSELSFYVIQDKKIEKLVLSVGIFIGDDDDSDDSVESQHKRRRIGTETQHSKKRKRLGDCGPPDDYGRGGGSGGRDGDGPGAGASGRGGYSAAASRVTAGLKSAREKPISKRGGGGRSTTRMSSLSANKGSAVQEANFYLIIPFNLNSVMILASSGLTKSK